MRCPGLNKDHVGSQQASSIRSTYSNTLVYLPEDIYIHIQVLTPRISLTPEYNWSVLVFWRTQNIMELHSKAVQVSNVQWSKIVMEGIV
jgi:hypothetical protein